EGALPRHLPVADRPGRRRHAHRDRGAEVGRCTQRAATPVALPLRFGPEARPGPGRKDSRKERDMTHAFDELAKGMAEGVSRREALRRLGGGVAGALLASLGLTRGAEAASRADCRAYCSSLATKYRKQCQAACQACSSTGCLTGAPGSLTCCSSGLSCC